MVRLNLLIEIGVLDTFAITESELNKFEYLDPLLKNSKLMPNSIANTIPIFDLLRDLNIYIFCRFACIILVSIREINMLKINQFNKIIAANWKLNGSLDYINSYFAQFTGIEIKNNVCPIICCPSIYLDNCSKVSQAFFLGGQECSNFEKGAYTGEISASMLREKNCNFCIVGHSERREFFNQTNKDISIKSVNLIKQEIIPILCVGETLENKLEGITKKVLHEQIVNSLPSIASKENIIIAYEPIWAIGSGLIPTLDEINEIHSFLKSEIDGLNNYKIIYGGSVKSSNSREIMGLTSVDGVLVGGASLDPIEFSKILVL